MFDVETLLSSTITDSNSTEFINVEEDLYVAVCTKREIKTLTNKSTNAVSTILELTWQLDDPTGEIAALTGRDTYTLRQGIFLDITSQGTLDMGRGRNVGLGKAREACGLNSPGAPFSFDMFVGKAAKVMVKHRILDDGARIAEVKSITALDA